MGTIDLVVKAETAKWHDDSIDLLHIDGLHTYEAVKRDYEQWYPKVKPGGIILFHDVVCRQKGFGVWKFWDGIKDKYETFQFNHGYGLSFFLWKKHFKKVYQS